MTVVYLVQWWYPWFYWIVSKVLTDTVGYLPTFFIMKGNFLKVRVIILQFNFSVQEEKLKVYKFTKTIKPAVLGILSYISDLSFVLQYLKLINSVWQSCYCKDWRLPLILRNPSSPKLILNIHGYFQKHSDHHFKLSLKVRRKTEAISYKGQKFSCGSLEIIKSRNTVNTTSE